MTSGAAACLLLALLVPVRVAAGGISVETHSLELQFSDGGELVRATACHPACDAGAALRQSLADANGLVDFGRVAGLGVEQRIEGPAGDIELIYSGPQGQLVHWKIPGQGHRLELATRGVHRLALRAGPAFTPPQAAGFGGWLERVRYVSIGSGKSVQIALDNSEASTLEGEWAGFRNRFWAVLVRSGSPGGMEISTQSADQGPVLVSPESREARSYSVYLGPVEAGAMRDADPALLGLLYAGIWFWLRWISFALAWLLGVIHTLVPTWAIAIMLMSLAVHVLMLPLSRIAERLQRQVNEIDARLAPELSRIKREFRGEQQAAQIIALYRTQRVHPLYSLRSMLGVALVIPVFIGAFDMLAEHIELAGAGFLWISDLSRPDALALMPFSLPFFGADFNLLPVLMTALSVIASALHQPLAMDAVLRRRQVRNMVILAAGFFALFYTFPSGMVLYWTTNNLISVIKSLLTRPRRAAR